MMYQAWQEWRQKDAIRLCSEETRERLRRFVQNHIKNLVFGKAKPGEKERRPYRSEWRARCGEWIENTPEALQLSGDLFDSYMMRGKARAYKEAMFEKKPTNSETQTESDFAASWSGYAEDCVRSMFQEELRKEIIVIRASRSSGADAPSVESFAKKGRGKDDDDGPTIEETVTQEEPSESARGLLPEVHHVMDKAGEVFSARDKFLLWGAAHGMGRTSSKLSELTGVAKSVLSVSYRDLEDRIVKAVTDHFEKPAPARGKTKTENTELPHGIILGICWDYLLEKFCDWTPEKRSEGTFDLVSPTTPT